MKKYLFMVLFLLSPCILFAQTISVPMYAHNKTHQILGTFSLTQSPFGVVITPKLFLNNQPQGLYNLTLMKKLNGHWRVYNPHQGKSQALYASDKILGDLPPLYLDQHHLCFMPVLGVGLNLNDLNNLVLVISQFKKTQQSRVSNSILALGQIQMPKEQSHSQGQNALVSAFD